ncbi:MAG TPA: SCO family protein [Mucilaginibacter sp.]|jgi:protein SCO1/2|nr:SCO family protein [Mucilaginibacter sp.]
MKNLLNAVVIIALFSACKFNQQKTLPIYGNRSTATKTINGQTEVDTVYQTIPPFKFINQYGDSVSNKNVSNSIYVADFFFTTCPSICPIMQRNMLTVYDAFKADPNFNILSYTIDPKHDSVNVLKKYADKLGVTGKSWLFLQGKKEETYQLATNYLVSKPQEDAKQQYIHDGLFILVDKQQRIRGSYDGTDPKQVNQLIEDIKTLKTEPDQTK